MKKPRTADVPTAWCIFLENILKVGTLKLPPPIPIVTDKRPIVPLIIELIIKDLGISSLIVLIFCWKNIFIEIRNASETKIIIKNSPLILLAKIDPRKDPSIIPGNHFLITSLSTLLNFKWDRIEETEVNKIIAKDDAIETCITTSDEYPRLIKTKYETGTIIIPPPTPNSPASKPESKPVDKNVMMRVVNDNTFK